MNKKTMKPASRHGVKIFASLFAFFLATTMLNAQQINWANATPRMAPGSEPLTVLGDSALLELDFTLSSAPVAQAKVEIKLPQYLEYAGSITLASGSAPITWTTAQTGDPTTVAGRTLTLSITSNGNSLPNGAYVRLRVRLRAMCGGNTIDHPAVQVRVLGNTTPVNGGAATASLQTMRLPVLNLTSSAPNQSFSTQSDIGNYTLSLTATNGEAHSARITLATDLYTALDNFQLDGAAIAATAAATSTQKTYTLNLTPAALNNTKINTMPRQIVFELTATRCGVHNVTSSIQYRYDTNCATYTGVNLSASFPAVSGLPNMVHQSSNYLDAVDNPITGNAPAFANHADIKMNGNTSTYIKTVFKNEGTADAYDILVYAMPYSQFMYMDIENIKYQVEGGAQQSLPSSKVQVNATINAYLNGSVVGGIPIYGYTRSEVVGKPRNITVTVDDMVPVGKTLTVWVPVVNGKLYDNGNRNVLHNYGTNVVNGYRIWVSQVRNRCMVTGPITSDQVTITYLGVPHFRELPGLASFKSNTAIHQTVRIADNYVYSSLPSDVYVKLPDWLTLNDMYRTTTAAPGGTVIAANGNIISHGDNTFSRQYTTTRNADCYMHFDFTADACAGVNRMDTIAYWFNQVWLGGTLDHVSQVFQPVTFECVNEGVALDEFGIRRTTKGLKDSDNNSIPDDGSIAPDGEIMQNTFIQNDEGYFYWEATVAASGPYSHLYIPLNSPSLSLSQAGSTNLRLPGDGSISINGGAEQPVLYTLLNNNELYLHYAGTLPAGAALSVKLPFTVPTPLNSAASLETKCYVSNTPVSSDPMSNDEPGVRFGKDRSATVLGSYTHGHSFSGTNDVMIFSNNDTKTNFKIGYMDNYHGGYLPSPYFYQEVRRIYYPYSITWELPEGYIMEDLRVANTQLDFTPAQSKNLLPAAGPTENRLVYNLHEMYDPNYDGSGTPLTPGKWMLPDDRYTLDFYVNIRATRGAPLGNSPVKTTGVYKHPYTGEELTYTDNTQFQYTGLSTQLTVEPAVLDAYSQALTLHTVTVANPNTIPLNDVYLYVAGNAANIRFKDKATSTETPGTGFGGRWFKVSNLMAASAVQDYEINFDYTGGASCGGDTVRIYTASGFDQAWTPNTAAALVTNDWDHVGARKMAVVRPAPARITGSISVPPALELSYNTAFTLTVDVHSTASPGILRNPSVTLSVPPGMQVVPGSARIEYPLGTLPRSVTGTFLPALNTALGMGSNLATTRTFTLNFDHINNNGVPGGAALLMPGSLAPGVTAGQQTARFTVNFLPMCQTTLAGLRFSGVYNATSSCGAAAQWNGLVNRTRVIYTDVPINYHFSATVQTATGNRAFNELRRRDTLVVELQKTIGVNEDMQTTDSLHLVLPATMDLDGFVTLRGKGTMQAGVALFTPTAADGGIIAGERHINISLPIAAYNAEASKGWGAGNELIYRIPVIYTPAGQTMALNPVNQIEASVQTNASINELICPDQRAAIGGGDVDIALVTALRNPDRIPTGFARPFEITSAGFAGNWYADSLTATTLATAATTYTPAALSSCNSTKVYVSSEFGGVNYGRVPLLQISKITALNDTVTTASGIPHILAVVANDTLPAGCAPDTVDNRGPRHGTLVINADRTFTYTPDAAFAGIDSLNYYIRCETDSSAARVYMAVIKPGSQNYVVCPSASIKIEVATAANVHYYWYDAPTDGNILASGSDINFINFTKIGDATESVWVEARWNNIIFPRHRIDVLAGTNCGGAPSGCLTTGSLVWKEDFDSYGSGDRAPDPGWKTIGKTTYTYQTTNNFGVILPAAGNYALLKGRNLGSPGVAAWFFSPLDDHTSPTDNTTGYFLNFDATKEAGRFYEFEMTGLCEGTDLTFSAWLMNINPPTWTPAGTYVVPIVEFVIEDMSGNVLGLFNTGEIPRQSVATWVNYAFPFTVPFGVTAVKVKFINAQLNATGTIGNDISIDDIEVRLCAPEVEISKPKSDTVICAGSSITFEGNYTDDGTFGVYGGTLKAQWIHSADDDMSNPNAWNFVGSPVTASGSISSTYTIPSATSAAHTGYYRMVVANDGSPDNFNSWNCRAMSEVIYLNVIESIIPPDIRVYVKPSATALHLSSYIDSLPYPYTLSWLPSADFSADERGSLDVSSWTAPRTATYKYTVNSASCGTFTAKAYVHVINRYNKTETIYICKDLLLSNRVNLNRIFGIEDGSGGAWTYPNDPDLVTQDNVTIVATGRHAGARIFNAVQAYIDASAAAYDAGMPNNKKFEIRYSNGNITKTVKLTVY